MEILKRFVTSPKFETFVIAVIVANAVTLGLETGKSVPDGIRRLLMVLDRVFLVIFTVEITLKLIVFRLNYPRDPWRLFDLAIVSIAWMPSTGAFSILRALRILRIVRVVGMVPSLRRVVGGLVAALPGMGSIVGLLALVFYIFSVMATKLFGAAFPEWFGGIGASAYSLFQIMTLESWSMGIVRPVMETFPHAWLFFIPFIVSTTFTVLNLFIGIIVAAMQSEHDKAAAEQREALHSDQETIISEIRALREDIAAMRQHLPPGREG